MQNLIQYIINHTDRGECQCGHCVDKLPDRLAPHHSVDLGFFWVSARNNPDPEVFRRLLLEEYPDFSSSSPMAATLSEMSYISIGGVLGDQGLALMMIGLGEILGLWDVLTPQKVLPGFDKSVYDQMMGMGLISASISKEQLAYIQKGG